MTRHDIARILDGCEYPVRVSDDVQESAKRNGIVIVYGASDDLMEFAGAIVDEVGCYNGGGAYVDSEGLQQSFDEVDHDDKEALREYFRRERRGVLIEALWDSAPGLSWVFKTTIPHSTFDVFDDGATYCRGIVFALADVATEHS